MAKNSGDSLTKSLKTKSSNYFVRTIRVLAFAIGRRQVVKNKEMVTEPDVRILENEVDQLDIVAVDSSELLVIQEPVVELPEPPHVLREDLNLLEAQNQAFKEGLLRLQSMNLDEDLFGEAVNALRSKYYDRRDPILGRDSQ